MEPDTHCLPQVASVTCESIKLNFGGPDLTQRRDRKPLDNAIVKGKRLSRLKSGKLIKYQATCTSLTMS